MRSTHSQSQLCAAAPISSLCSVFTFHFGICLRQICYSVFYRFRFVVPYSVFRRSVCCSAFYCPGFVDPYFTIPDLLLGIRVPGSAVPCFTATRNWLLFEKLKGNCSLKRKKQSVKVIRENSCMLKEAVTTRSSRSQMLFKIGVLENFAIFTGKHPCWSLF